MKSCKTPFLGFLHTFFLPASESPFAHCAARVLCNGRSRPGLHIGGQLQGGDCFGPGKHRLQPMAVSLCCVFRTASFSKPFSEWKQYSTCLRRCQGGAPAIFTGNFRQTRKFPPLFIHGAWAGSSGSGPTGTGWQTPPPRRSAWPPPLPPGATARRRSPPRSARRRHKYA